MLVGLLVLERLRRRWRSLLHRRQLGGLLERREFDDDLRVEYELRDSREVAENSLLGDAPVDLELLLLLDVRREDLDRERFRGRISGDARCDQLHVDQVSGVLLLTGLYTELDMSFGG